MSHPGVPPPRVLLIDHIRIGLWPHTLWTCHKSIYKDTRDGDESGAKNQSIINPTLRYIPPSSRPASRSPSPVTPLTDSYCLLPTFQKNITTCTPDRSPTLHTRSWTRKMNMKSPILYVATIPTRNRWR